MESRELLEQQIRALGKLLGSQIEGVQQSVDNKFEEVQRSMIELKGELKELHGGNPLWRIQQLESWKEDVEKELKRDRERKASNANKFLVGIGILVVGAIATGIANIIFFG